MVGLFVLLLLFLLVAVMFMHYRYERRSKQTSVSRKDLLLGYDFSQGSPWESFPMTKETGKNQLKDVEESHDQDALEKIFSAPTDEGIEKKDIGTLVVDDNSPTDEDVGKKEVVAIIVEDDSPTDEDVEKDVEGKILYTEFQKLLLLADSMIASCTPQKSDYGRGYHMGIQIHFNNGHRGSLPDHYSIAEIARSNGCRNVHAFARGYLNGYMGLKPEYNG